MKRQSSYFYHEKYEEIKPLDLKGEKFHRCWMNTSPLWEGNHLSPTRSCAQEGWEDVGGGGDADGNHVLQSAVGVEAEAGEVVVEEEGEAEDAGVVWVEGTMEAATFETAEGGWRTAGDGDA